MSKIITYQWIDNYPNISWYKQWTPEQKLSLEAKLDILEDYVLGIVDGNHPAEIVIVDYENTN